jgi:hypothetical protein
MSIEAALAGLLGLAVLLASARLILWQLRAPAQAHARWWRLAALLALQPLCAALLYCVFLPPTLPGEAGTLIVATAATRSVPSASGDALVALPEAPDLPGAERIPDLATALRRHPGTRRLRIVGAGLEPRDRDAAAGLALDFDPPELPRGLVRLDSPARVAPGTVFRVGGRANGLAGGSVELIDPAGRRVDLRPLAGAGDFIVTGTARVPGLALFTLRLRDGRTLVSETEVPIETVAEPAPRLLLLGGAPGPDLKYLRRWASDSGLALHSQFNAGGGIQLGDPPLALNAATLRGFDLVVLDERSWAELGNAQRGALIAALRDGLGVLLRVTGPVPEAMRSQWRALGFALSGGADTATVKLPPEAVDADARAARRGPLSAGEDGDAPELTRFTTRVTGNDTVPLLRDATGAVLASWRGAGRGRIGIWIAADSYALILSGRADRYGEWWSTAFATLARARADATPSIDAQPRAGQRIVFCGIGAEPGILSPAGATTRLLADPASAGCAAYWPDRPGWHRVQWRDTANAARARPFFVHASDTLPGIRAAELREATLRLANALATAPAQEGTRRRGPAWPWLLAWLLASAVLWWFERARIGKAAADSPDLGLAPS